MNRLMKITTAIAVVIFISACGQNKKSSTELTQEEVRARVGQLFMLAFSGNEADIVTPLIKERGIGALYLSNDNLNEAGSAAKLLNELQEASLNGVAKLPILTAADQEGAWAVITPTSASGPGNMALGGAAPEHTRAMYATFAKEMTSAGVFCDLAPCADVNSNPLNPIIGTRSFGENAEQVAIRVAEAVKGLHDNNMIATAKHFPGHGNTATDSHSGLPVVDRSKEDIENIDIPPFKAAIDAGVDIVMTAHIIYTALDSVNPATLSPTILKDYLRGELGFKGLIITDSFNMWAIQKFYSPPEAAVQAILAGADMIMLAEERYGEDVGNYIENQYKILDRVEQAVMTGEIPMERLNEAYNRVVELKKKYALESRIPVDVENAVATVGSEENMKVAIEAACASVNLMYDNAKVLPLSKKQDIAVVRLAKENVREIMDIAEGIGPNYANAYNAFVGELKELGFNVKEYQHTDAISESVVLAVSENYPLPGKSLDLEVQRERISGIKKNNKCTVVNVALKDPYDANLVEADAYVSAVGSNYSNAVAAARFVAGKFEATATFSVTPIKK